MKASKPAALRETTPFPNALLDEIMPRLKDTEWRVLCVIVRQTLGWQGNEPDGRKERDWLSRSQLKIRTGRHSEAVTAAIENLVRQDYISVQNSKGQSLSSAAMRRAHRGRIYYALSGTWRRRVGLLRSLRQSRSGEILQSTSSIFERQTRKSEHDGSGKANGTKETFTKEKHTKHQEELDLRCNRGNANTAAEFAAFIQAFRATARAARISQPNEQLSPEESLQLSNWVTHSEESLQLALLEKYFRSPLPYIRRNGYSLGAFIHTRNILPLQK